MGITVDEVRQQPHFQHHGFHAVTHVLARKFRMISAQRFRDNFANRHSRVE
ncbi:Uncharacterised protein [Salmonella enterica subsp. enterica serovar Bovismorbificans]|uniref:Uncharacterized protein n=1 Tax=Salmonella enterica subsp. enterica serovar Bovismorbificans TaxID=58097 RepID=A0A655BS37_SALET|nr:Uncharacterised protein [Salmonella enterica subsp. enterica serovar Bovismorbificans]